MEQLIEMMMKDVVKLGTYIVSITNDATKHIEEQYRKAGSPTEESKALAAEILADVHITLGEPYIVKGKLSRLLAAHLAKDSQLGMKNYIFALRNMLTHSHYKEYMKALDKPSLKLTEQELFIQYVEERLGEQLEDYSKDTWKLLYMFVEASTMINRILSMEPESEEHALFSLLLPSLVNPAMAILKERAATSLDEQKLHVTYEAMMQDEELNSWLRAANVYLRDVDVASLEGQQFVDGKHASVVLLAKMLQTVSEEYIEGMAAPQLVVKEAAQKVKKAQPMKPVKSDKQWQKELYELEQERDALKAENKQLNDAMKQLEQQQRDLSKELLALKNENEAITGDLAQLLEERTVSKQAVQMVQQLSQLALDLQQELLKEPEPIMEADPTFIEQIQQLKLAVVGGHQKYHAQLKSTLKNEQLLCINPDSLNFDPKKLSNYDVIVFSSGYSNHSLYNKAFDYLKRNGEKDKCLMLKTQPNANGLAKRIYHFIHGIE